MTQIRVECILKVIELIISAIPSLVAVFLGAWLAFKFQNLARKKETRANAVAAGNRTIFTLMRQYNSLLLLQRDIIEPARSHPLRFVAMLPSLNLDYKDLKFDIDSLSFILETSHRHCLADLFMAEQKFQTAMLLFDERSRLHLQTVQPLLEKAGLIENNNGTCTTKQEVEGVLGARVSNYLSRLTDDAIEHIDLAVKDLKETSDNLNRALKQLYPEGQFINFEPLK